MPVVKKHEQNIYGTYQCRCCKTKDRSYTSIDWLAYLTWRKAIVQQLNVDLIQQMLLTVGVFVTTCKQVVELCLTASVGFKSPTHRWFRGRFYGSYDPTNRKCFKVVRSHTSEIESGPLQVNTVFQMYCVAEVKCTGEVITARDTLCINNYYSLHVNPLHHAQLNFKPLKQHLILSHWQQKRE